MTERPAGHYRDTITDPDDFVGREALLAQIRREPRLLRVLLGGRRIGKSSLLRAIEWRLLRPDLEQPRRAFPVYIDLQRVEPRNLPHFRFMLVIELRQAIVRWEQSQLRDALDVARDVYVGFLRRVAEVKVGFDFLAKFEVKVVPGSTGVPDELSDDGFVTAMVRTFEELRPWHFDGVCFLIDEAEYVIRQGWANNAWPYFRSLKSSNTALGPLLGMVLSGYRDLKNYRQPVGSPLNNAHVVWLSPFSEDESVTLVEKRAARERARVAEPDRDDVLRWAGAHPFPTQQLLNALFDGRTADKTMTVDRAAIPLVRTLNAHFANWWNDDGLSDGFGDHERTVYRALIRHREADSRTLAREAQLPEGRVDDALEILIGTGVVRRIDAQRVIVGAQLFERWVLSYE